MAAIVPVTTGPLGEFFPLRSATAQATTGQTDWVQVPAWAQFCVVILNVTATAGTTPICLPSLLTADPVTLTDTNTQVLGATTTGGVTSTGLATIEVGPGITGIANAVAIGGTGGTAQLNAILPALMGVKVLNDRTTGDETYTYKLSLLFRSGSR